MVLSIIEPPVGFVSPCWSLPLSYLMLLQLMDAPVWKWLVSLFHRDCFFFYSECNGSFISIFMGVKPGTIRVMGSGFLTRINLPCLGCFLLILIIHIPLLCVRGSCHFFLLLNVLYTLFPECHFHLEYR